MRRVWIYFVATVLVASLAPPAAAGSSSPSPQLPERLERLSEAMDPDLWLSPDRLLVEVAPGREQALTALEGRLGVRERRSPAEGTLSVRLAAGADPAAAIAAYRAHPDVRSVRRAVRYRTSTSSVTPDDPLFGDQYHLERIMAPKAWTVTTGGSRKIAIVDTGVNTNHEDLQGRVLTGRNIIKGTNKTGDDNGHGTAMAGIAAAATDNAKGLAGVTWSDKILPVKALDAEGFGDEDWIADGIRWAADNGADVVNLSLGGPFYSKLLHDAVVYAQSKGALVVAASGNQGWSLPGYPAAFEGVLSVGATDTSDEIPAWVGADCMGGPNYGSTLDLVAPGHQILAPAHLDLNANGKLDDYQQVTGTSAAAPVVVGVAALVWARNPSWTADQVAAGLKDTADDLGLPGPDRFYGAGRVNAFRALGGSVAQPQAQTEPDAEPGNTLDQAEALSGSAQATLYPAGDRDWWKVTVPADGHLRVKVTPPSGIDPALEVYSPDLRLLEIVDSTCAGSAEEVRLNLTSGGEHYIGVRNWLPHGSKNSYTIETTVGSGTGGSGYRPPNRIQRALFPWYDARNTDRRTWLMTANVGTGSGLYWGELASDEAIFDPGLGLARLLPGESADPLVFGRLVGGPLEVRWFEGDPLIASQRVLWEPSNFEETGATLDQDLTRHAHFTWYDGKTTNGRDWVVASNPGPWRANVQIRFAGSQIASKLLEPGENLIWNDKTRVGGPVEVVSDHPVLASRRTLWFKGRNFSELPGIRGESLTTSYIFPWYDAKATDGSNWVMVSNPAANGQSIDVRIRIENPDGGGPLVNEVVTVPAGDAVSRRYPGVVGGPVRVTGQAGSKPFVTSQRNLFDAGRSFEEVTGEPVSGLTSQAHFSWYDAVNTGGSDWILVANPSTTSPVTVTIRVAGETVWGPQSIAAGRIVTPRFLDTIGGPVTVSADGPVVASRRTLWHKDFTELLGLRP